MNTQNHECQQSRILYVNKSSTVWAKSLNSKIEKLCMIVRYKSNNFNTVKYFSAYKPLKPSGYTSERNLVLMSPSIKRELIITSRSNAILCVTPKNKTVSESD